MCMSSFDGRGSIGAGLYGSPLSHNGGVAAASMGDSCDEVEALDNAGDMCMGDGAERDEERSEKLGEFECDKRRCT